jgi:hypothetical protein
MYGSFNEKAQEAWDFARCVKPDGSVYGTKGECQPPAKPLHHTLKKTEKKKEEKMCATYQPWAPLGMQNVVVPCKELGYAERSGEALDFASGRGKPCGASHIAASKSCKVGSGGGSGKAADTERKAARAAMVEQRHKVAEAKKKREETAASGDKKAAAAARREHIEAKKKYKELQAKHEQASAASGDLRRYGREMNRYKAKDSELQQALDSGKLPAKTAEKVRVELAQRKASREQMGGS